MAFWYLKIACSTAIKLAHQALGVVLEPSGAASLAALLEADFSGQTVGVILCGSNLTQQANAGVVMNGGTMMRKISGEFQVKMTPQAFTEGVGDSSIGRMGLDKQFHGDLEATSQGQMLAAGTDTEGSAGYVALERVSGTLDGLSGSFALQHNGVMNRGAPQLTITVVPDSGTGQLRGLAGSMNIRREDGKHFYDLEYTLPEIS